MNDKYETKLNTQTQIDNENNKKKTPHDKDDVALLDVWYQKTMNEINKQRNNCSSNWSHRSNICYVDIKKSKIITS